jgi:hypothetical protein
VQTRRLLDSVVLDWASNERPLGLPVCHSLLAYAIEMIRDVRTGSKGKVGRTQRDVAKSDIATRQLGATSGHYDSMSPLDQ